jgi:hypothetical protein
MPDEAFSGVCERKFGRFYVGWEGKAPNMSAVLR